MKTAVLLVNVGTPASARVSDVRKYLFEFMNDKRVIDLPWLLRKILVNLIIVPFRAPKSAKLYEKLWTANGSPLLFHGLSLQNKLQTKLDDNYIVKLAMNYQQPNIKDVISSLLKQNINKIIVFPLFPQYASSTTGSAVEKIMKLLQNQNTIPSVEIVSQYYFQPAYIEALAAQVNKFNLQEYDHVLISYHGLPLSQVYRSHAGKSCDEMKCTIEINKNNEYCYHAACYATSRFLVEKLQLPKEKYSIGFQSRIAKNWLSPFTDEMIDNLAKNGVKRLLVICPSFTADCLETIVEVSHEYKELFLQHGGEKLTLVESLNDSDLWVEAIENIILHWNSLQSQ